MPDLLSPELLALRERAEQLATGTLIALRDDTALTPEQRRDRVRHASQTAGLYGLTQSEQVSALSLLVARETLASHGVGHLDGCFGADPGILGAVGEPLRTSHLLPLLAGDKRAGFAFTEPSDAERPTWARVEGDELVITGRKSYVTGGPDLSFMTALVEVEGTGPSMVVIDTDRPGVSVERVFGSLDGSRHAAYRFDAVHVPMTHAVGKPGDGRSRALAKISSVRRTVAADCVGTSTWLINLVAEVLKRPRRSGALAEHERVRLRFGQMRITAFAARSMVYRVARLADAGQDVVNESIAAKVFASEAADEIVDAAIQLVGGEALVTGHPLESAVRRLRATRLVEGENDTLRVNVSRGFLDLGKGRL
jgi:alkylation response protein AidB-like acyl-CoA dehydrogenase